MRSVVVFSPAKINLYLAVTGRRGDGYHDLVSIAAPLMLGDTIWLRAGSGPGEVALTCNDPLVPFGRDNLAVRAAEVFRSAAGIGPSIDVCIEKRIPMGAGLGGGSSNASAVLLGLNALFGHPLSLDALSGLAASLGSDCPLFLAGGPCVMRGRGEQVAPLPPHARQRVSGRRVLVFKPDFPVHTFWAYATLAAGGLSAYLDPRRAEAAVTGWIEGAEGVSRLLFNSFESVVCRKFVALAALAEVLRSEPGVEGVLLSGSGSACFALLEPTADAARLSAAIRDALGETAWIGNSILA